MSADLVAALQSLPHGPEFRFIDRLTDLDPGRHGAGEYKVKVADDAPFLRGHFPGQPMMPGVLLVEAVAQLAGTVAQSDPAIPALPGLKLTALRGVKILGTAVPGQTIQLEARVTGRLGNLVQAQGSASVEGKQILHADLVLSGS